MKHIPYHTKRFWKQVEKEFKTNTTYTGNPYQYLCHGSPSFKEQWQLEDFRNFCRLHAQHLPEGNPSDDDMFDLYGTLFIVVGREPRLRFLAHMVATISLRRPKNQ